MIADGPAEELLAGGWYFATETARILGGAHGALLPEQGAALLGERDAAHVALEAGRVAEADSGAFATTASAIRRGPRSR